VPNEYNCRCISMMRDVVGPTSRLSVSGLGVLDLGALLPLSACSSCMYARPLDRPHCAHCETQIDPITRSRITDHAPSCSVFATSLFCEVGSTAHAALEGEMGTLTFWLLPSLRNSWRFKRRSVTDAKHADAALLRTCDRARLFVSFVRPLKRSEYGRFTHEIQRRCSELADLGRTRGGTVLYFRL
jgi:hypothetical protein